MTAQRVYFNQSIFRNKINTYHASSSRLTSRSQENDAVAALKKEKETATMKNKEERGERESE